MEKGFGVKEFDIDWDNYIVFIVKFVLMREEVINENSENFKKEVKGYFDIIFENMNWCKGEEGYWINIYLIVWWVMLNLKGRWRKWDCNFFVGCFIFVGYFLFIKNGIGCFKCLKIKEFCGGC